MNILSVILLVIYILGYIITFLDMMHVFYMHSVNKKDVFLSLIAALILALLWPLYAIQYLLSTFGG